MGVKLESGRVMVLITIDIQCWGAGVLSNLNKWRVRVGCTCSKCGMRLMGKIALFSARSETKLLCNLSFNGKVLFILLRHCGVWGLSNT